MKNSLPILLIMFILHTQPKMLWLGDVGNPGARYPISDIYDGKENPAKQGQLNSVGMRQQFLLGTYERADYIDGERLIQGKFYHKAIEAFACLNVDRTFDSALARLYGIFPPGTGWTIPQNVGPEYLVPPFQSDYTFSDQNHGNSSNQFALQYGFQPVPVWPLDDYLNDPCPNAGIIKTKRLQQIAKSLTTLQKEHALFLSKAKLVFNLSSLQMNIPSMADLYDTLMSDLTLGKQLPKQFDASDMKQLKYLSDSYNVLLNDGSYGQVFSYLLLSVLKSKMQLAKTKKIGEKKWSLFFPKQGAITPLLRIFDLTSYQCLTQKYKNKPVTSLNCVQPPTFSANFLMQLHEDDAFLHQVKIKYNGQYVNLCGKKQKECDYDEFWSKVVIDKAAYDAACGTKA